VGCGSKWAKKADYRQKSIFSIMLLFDGSLFEANGVFH
jgi:hypothetical protein